MEIGDILNERAQRYGEFSELAEISQNLKVSIGSNAGFNALASDQQEALEMICHKIARILNGDPNYPDSWLDIAGYAKLVADRLAEDGAAADAETEAQLATLRGIAAKAEAETAGLTDKKIRKAYKLLTKARKAGRIAWI